MNEKVSKRPIEAFFLGSRAQNIAFFQKLINKSILNHQNAREQFTSYSEIHITEKIKSENNFMDSQKKFQVELQMVLQKLKKQSTPSYSSRHLGHMYWENSIPSLIGKFVGILYNPNNCSFQSSPVSTILQIKALQSFSELFGYSPIIQKNSAGLRSWGHLTSGGTIANCQAMWAARNCKFMVLGLRNFLISQDIPDNLKNISIKLPNKIQKELFNLTGWEILNIDNDTSMEFFSKVFDLCSENQKMSLDEFKEKLSDFMIGNIGLLGIYDQLREVGDQKWKKGKIPPPVILISGKLHYSFSKSLSLLGIGEKNVKKISIDEDGRMDIESLKKELENCLQNHIPVLSVIGIAGTSQASAIDPLHEIHLIQSQFKEKGLYFHFHIDGAYGGYFCSMIRQKSQNYNSLSSYVVKQLQSFCYSDSITFDPHKTGYVPYECGGIIYKNHRLRENINFQAKYMFDGSNPNVSIYGIEGSRGGSSAISLYLSLSVLPLRRDGHGEILERTIRNSKIFLAALYQIENQVFHHKYFNQKREEKLIKQRFKCCSISRKYSQKNEGVNLEQEKFAYKAISKIKSLSFIENGIKETQKEKYYLDLGSDLNIICFGLNFGQNLSLKKYNKLNQMIINRCTPKMGDKELKQIFVSETEICKTVDKEQIYNSFLLRNSLIDDIEDKKDKKIVFMRSAVMNPFLSQLSTKKSGQEIFVKKLLEIACECLDSESFQNISKDEQNLFL